MAQQVGSVRRCPEPDPFDRAPHDVGDRCAAQPANWSLKAHEDEAGRTAGPGVADVGGQRPADIVRQRDPIVAVTLSVNGQLGSFPVNVLEFQVGDLTRTEAEPGQQEQDGMVAAPTVGTAVTAPYETAHVLCRNRGRVVNRQYGTVGTAAPRSSFVEPWTCAKRKNDRSAVTCSLA